MDEFELSLFKKLADMLIARKWTCAVAESCTGGLIGATITSIPGASEWFAGGIIAYSNKVKQEVLGVSAHDIEVYGAVSDDVVRQMSKGACKLLNVPAAVSVSGIAGPDGGTNKKPVGTVWFGTTVMGKTLARCSYFRGNRDQIRHQAVLEAVKLLIGSIELYK